MSSWSKLAYLRRKKRWSKEKLRNLLIRFTTPAYEIDIERLNAERTA
jgi:hypothetical protein